MIPVEFKEQNKVYAENQDEYLPLPAYAAGDEKGMVISVWKLSIFEKLKILFLGKIWVSMMTFKHPLQPIRLDLKYPFKKPPCQQKKPFWERVKDICKMDVEDILFIELF